MEIDKLIEQLTELAHLAAMNEDAKNAELFEKAAFPRLYKRWVRCVNLV